MSGLRKAKKYDWKDSNLALFGSDTEKQVKKDSAMTEPAWKGCGQKPGLKIWRIVKFKVTHWPEESYGEFYSGDSYIILNTYKDKDSDALLHDLHFWIGKESTQDEYGTAAYKTVELDTYLDDVPVQHREVQDHESSMFKQYFKEIVLLKGGADSGFRRIKPKEYEPRLLHFNGSRRNVKVVEVPIQRKYLKSGDVFVMDLGLKIIQWNGLTCNKDEKWRAQQFVQSLKGERGKAQSETLEEGDIESDSEFEKAFRPDDDDDDDEVDESADKDGDKVLLRVSDASGSLEMSEVSRGSEIKRSQLDSNDVFIADVGDSIFVWVGKRASDAETKNGFGYAHHYLKSTKHPYLPISVISEGKKNALFMAATSA